MPIHPLTLESANLFCGNWTTVSQNSPSLHLKLVEVKLPHFEEFYIDHRPGGAPVAIEVDVMYQKLGCEFFILGMDRHVYEIQRAWSREMNIFHFYGVLRDPETGNAYQVAAEIIGRLGNVEGVPWRRGDLYHTHCSIRGITAYTFSIGGRQIYNWNFDKNELTIGTQPDRTPQSIEQFADAPTATSPVVVTPAEPL